MSLVLAGIGSAIAGAGSVISSGQQAKVARENTDKTIAANKKMAEYQYSKDLEMWNQGNKYNSPSAQMDRLKAAGLNPNLVYGSGSAAGNTSGQLPKYNAPTVDYNYKPPVDIGGAIEGATGGFAQGLGMFQDMRLKQAQSDNMKEQNKTLKAEAELKTALAMNADEIARGTAKYATTRATESDWRGSLAKNKHIQFASINKGGLGLGDYQADSARLKVEQQSKDIEKVIAGTAKINAETEIAKKTADWFEAKMIAQLGGAVLNAAGKLIPTGRAAGMVKGGLSGGTIKAPGKSGKPDLTWSDKFAPRVTPKTEFGRTHPAWRQHASFKGKRH